MDALSRFLFTFSGFTVILIWWFSSKGRERARRASCGRGGCPPAEQLLPLISTEKVHSVAKSTLSKVQMPLLSPERGKVLPRCPKFTLSKVRRCQKKKSKNLAGIWLDRACESEASDSSAAGRVPRPDALTRSDRDQHQTRSFFFLLHPYDVYQLYR